MSKERTSICILIIMHDICGSHFDVVWARAKALFEYNCV